MTLFRCGRRWAEENCPDDPLADAEFCQAVCESTAKQLAMNAKFIQVFENAGKYTSSINFTSTHPITPDSILRQMWIDWTAGKVQPR